MSDSKVFMFPENGYNNNGGLCDYYGISEGSEKAAYLMGYIAQRMYRMLQRINRYGRL